jgi:hypothetical protein
MRAEGICGAKLAARGPLPLVVAVCGLTLPHVGRSVDVCGSPRICRKTQKQKFAPIPQSPNPSLPLFVGGGGGSIGGAFGDTGHANNREKARRPLLSPHDSHSLSLSLYRWQSIRQSIYGAGDGDGGTPLRLRPSTGAW